MFQQAQECIASLVCAHLFVSPIAMLLNSQLALSLNLKVTDLLDLPLFSKLPAVTGWIRT